MRRRASRISTKRLSAIHEVGRKARRLNPAVESQSRMVQVDRLVPPRRPAKKTTLRDARGTRIRFATTNGEFTTFHLPVHFAYRNHKGL
jgi:hypothetical protein